MRQPQRQQELQPQELPEQQLPVDVPPTEPDEQELHPHRRQPQLHVEQEFEELLPLLVPPTEPEELPLLQVQVHVQRFELFELLVLLLSAEPVPDVVSLVWSPVLG